MNASAILSLSLSCCLVLACGSSAAPDAPESSSQAVRAAEPVPDVTGTWAFDLDASDVLGPIRARCDAKSGSDAAKTTACVDEIRTQARREKVRFGARDGRPTYTSFMVKDGRETLFLEVPVALDPDGPGRLLAKVAGPASGPSADDFARSGIQALRLGIQESAPGAGDAGRLVIVDPKKGRLVYSREP